MSETILLATAELDAVIEDRFLNLVWDETKCRVCGWPLAKDTAEGCVADNCSMRPPPSIRADAPRPYSSDLNEAWKLVEEMRHRGFAVAVVSCAIGWICDVALGDFAYVNPQRPLGDQTPELAICRAVLTQAGVL